MVRKKEEEESTRQTTNQPITRKRKQGTYKQELGITELCHIIPREIPPELRPQLNSAAAMPCSVSKRLNKRRKKKKENKSDLSGHTDQETARRRAAAARLSVSVQRVRGREWTKWRTCALFARAVRVREASERASFRCAFKTSEASSRCCSNSLRTRSLNVNDDGRRMKLLNYYTSSSLGQANWYAAVRVVRIQLRSTEKRSTKHALIMSNSYDGSDEWLREKVEGSDRCLNAASLIKRLSSRVLAPAVVVAEPPPPPAVVLVDERTSPLRSYRQAATGGPPRHRANAARRRQRQPSSSSSSCPSTAAPPHPPPAATLRVAPPSRRSSAAAATAGPPRRRVAASPPHPPPAAAFLVAERRSSSFAASGGPPRRAAEPPLCRYSCRRAAADRG
uniref:Uncharacterized protein n=1 Tax=Oryza sativa subsp. japonica TaxID=39947 RepID=Q75GL9_ORYSJ|nr:unknown protein [Oryza sativa Japonica Group]